MTGCWSPRFGEPIGISGPEGAWDRVRADLNRHGVAVLHARLDDWRPDLGNAPRLRAVLGQDWARYLELRHPGTRARFAASRLMLKSAAAAALRVPPEAVPLGYTPAGRPYLRGYDAVDVSLSHTGDLLAVALTTRGLVGIDVERTDRRLDTPGMARHLCTPHEREAIEGMAAEQRNEVLVRLWTLKEAYTKAIGRGLQVSFTDFGFPLDGGATGLRAPDGTPSAYAEWEFRSYCVEGSHTVSVAVGDTGFGGERDTTAQMTLDPAVVEALTRVLGEEEPELPTSGLAH